MGNEPHQPKLDGIPFDDVDDALNNLVQDLGGFKKVGPQIWPAMSAEEATQRLRHCLNKSRREKLGQHELIFLLQMGRKAGSHRAKQYLDEVTGYTRSAPADPADEVAELQRLYIESVQAQRAIADRLERLVRGGTVLAVVK